MHVLRGTDVRLGAGSGFRTRPRRPRGSAGRGQARGEHAGAAAAGGGEGQLLYNKAGIELPPLEALELTRGEVDLEAFEALVTHLKTRRREEASPVQVASPAAAVDTPPAGGRPGAPDLTGEGGAVTRLLRASAQGATWEICEVCNRAGPPLLMAGQGNSWIWQAPPS